jgi:hypothetical protein
MRLKRQSDWYSLLEEIPADIGITKIGDEWYLTSTHGDPDGVHSHQEIRLDWETLLELRDAIVKEIEHPS